MPEMTLADLIEDYEFFEDLDEWCPSSTSVDDAAECFADVWDAMNDLGIVAVKHNGFVYRAGEITPVEEFGGCREIPDACDIWFTEEEESDA